jgi:hypothetical protein
VIEPDDWPGGGLLSGPNQPDAELTVEAPSIRIVALDAMLDEGPTTPWMFPTPPCSTPSQLKVLPTWIETESPVVIVPVALE